LPSRLDLPRFLVRVQPGDLERTRRWIADEFIRTGNSTILLGRESMLFALSVIR
jgi:hypothetical protein